MRNKLIVWAWYAAAFATILLGIISCGTVKKTTTGTSEVTEQTETQTTTQVNKIIESSTYGDTLSGASFLGFLPPAAPAPDSAGAGKGLPKQKDSTQTITGESNGVKLKINVTPRRDHKGNVTGTDISYQAIAKPTSKTTTHEQSSSTENTKGNKKATSAVHSTEDIRAGWSMPAWVWWVIAAIAGIVLLILFKRALNAIKKRMKIP